MKIHQGRLFGEIIIGGGIGYLVYRKSGNLLLAVVVGIGIAVADYVLLTFSEQFKKKK